MTNESDNRALERYTLELPSKICIVNEEGEKVYLDLATENVCAGGAYFETHQKLPIGTKVTIDLVIPLEKLKQIKGKNTLIEISGSVVRKDDKGVAVSFEEQYKMSPIKTGED